MNLTSSLVQRASRNQFHCAKEALFTPGGVFFLWPPIILCTGEAHKSSIVIVSHELLSITKLDLAASATGISNDKPPHDGIESRNITDPTLPVNNHIDTQSENTISMASAARLLRPLHLALLSPTTTPRPSPTLLLRAACRQHPSTTPTYTYTPLRQQHTIPRPRPPQPATTTTTTTQTDQPSSPPQPRDEYELTFTCTPCTRRSTHRISKHGYHRGSVLVTCPGCRNRHVISDHLGIFGSDRPGGWTIEDLLRERGEGVKRGRLQPAAASGEVAEEDLEFWDDGTVTTRDRDEVERRLRWERKEVEGGEGAPGASFKSVKPGEKKEE